MLVKYYGESGPLLRMIYKCFVDFRCGRRSGRPAKDSTPEIIEKNHDIVTKVKIAWYFRDH